MFRSILFGRLRILQPFLASSSLTVHRFQSQGSRYSVPFVEGEMMQSHASKTHHRKLNPDNIPHYVKAKIQNDRRAIGLTEVDDWKIFAEHAVYIPTKSGPMWVGNDDPRCEKFMRRRLKHQSKPMQWARKEPGEDRAKALEDHPLRVFFTTPTDLNDPLSVAEGLWKTGAIDDYDVKLTASRLKWNPRPPVVSIMGHVDHGKTTLLDYIRKSNIAAGEAGGITQSIGAFTVIIGPDGVARRASTESKTPGYRNTTPPSFIPIAKSEKDLVADAQSRITFVDTPGHRAFSEMRRAGANATDIIVLIVSTVDGVKPQTREVVELARETNIPIVVAANKIDRNEDVTRVKDELREIGVKFEEDGGDTLFQPISALHGTNVQELLELILLQAAMMELSTPAQSRAEVTVIDSRAPNRHFVAGIVRCGTLKPGMVLASGMTYAIATRVLDETETNDIKVAPVGTPVLLSGFKMLPKPGTVLFQLANERHGQRFNELMRDVYITEGSRESWMQTLRAESMGLRFNRKPDNNVIRQFDSIPFNIVVKAGTFGQLQALMSLLYELPTLDGVHLALKSAEVGGIGDRDILLLTGPQMQGAFLVFGESQNSYHMDIPSFLQAHYFDIVYEGVQWLKERLVELLPKEYVENIRAQAICKQIFRASQAGEGNAAGLFVKKGVFRVDAPRIRVRRQPRTFRKRTADDIIEPETVYEGCISELRRFKEKVPSVDEGLECGLILEDNFRFEIGDLVEMVEKIEIQRNVEEEFTKAAEVERRNRARREREAAEREADVGVEVNAQ